MVLVLLLGCILSMLGMRLDSLLGKDVRDQLESR